MRQILSRKSWFLTGLILCLISCNQSSQPATQNPAQATAAKRYHLKGKVVSIDEQAKMANIDAEEIPGFMSAMTMPYQIKPVDELNKLCPGDAITADVVEQGDSYWLENVAVTGHLRSPHRSD